MTLLALALIVIDPATAMAQSQPVYLGGTAAGNAASRGPLHLGGPVWTTGGVVGLRLTGAWSVEIEADRGFGSGERVSPESRWISYAPLGSSPEERERLAVRATFRRIDTAREGYSVHGVWKSREPGPVNVGVYVGISWRYFDQRVIRTITFVPDDPAIPLNDPNVQDADDTRRVTAGGYTGGLMVPIRIRDSWTVAPDVRFTFGFVDDSYYRSLSGAVRLMWGF